MSGNRAGGRVVVGMIAMALLFPAFIVFLFGLGFWGDELDKTAETTGTIAAPPRPEGPGDLGYDPDDDLAPACRTDVAFVVDGRTVTVESDASTGNCDRVVGEKVEVHYDPSNPYEYTVGSKTTAQVIGVVMMVAAGIWTLIVGALTWGIFRAMDGKANAIPAWVPRRDVVLGQVPLGAYEPYDGGSAPRRTEPDLSAMLSTYDAPPPAPEAPAPGVLAPTPTQAPAPTPQPPVAASAPPPDRIWDPADTGTRPDRAGWYPTGDGTMDRWYNGLSWSDATQPRGGAPR